MSKRDKEAYLGRRFGENLRTERLAQKLTQEQLAIRSGLDRSFVGQVERAETNVSIDNIQRLADALKTDPMKLFRP